MNFSGRRSGVVSISFWTLLALFCVVVLYSVREKMRFGIDLVGGTYITLEVQTNQAVEAELAEKMLMLPDKLKKSRKPLPLTKEVKDETLILTFDSTQALQEVASFLTLSEPRLKQTVEGTKLKLQFEDKVAKRIKEEAVLKNIEVLHSRLNKLGVEETPVAKQGEKNIVVELPGVGDPQKAKSIMGKMAKLEFKLVEREAGSKEDLLYEIGGEELPPDKEIVLGKEGRYFLLSKYTDITGRFLKDAKAGFGGHTGVEPVVTFQFNEVGSEKFYELTRKNFGKALAIVLDGEVLLAPTIQQALRGSGEITGIKSMEACKELAILLKSGSFAAPVTFEEERQIGPSLGSDSIYRGLMSCLIGLLLLLVFSVFYYKLSGLLSFVALLYNLLLILVGMYWLGATLTLPGIAGLVLTVGMAIDCSILIYERIREELAAGVSVKTAVNNGFSDAMIVIIDSNITHILTALILYKFGTGPIRGFAVTLLLGTAATLVTGLTFLRSMFNFILETFDIKKLSI
jgi:preprotein translocase subunit SecD